MTAIERAEALLEAASQKWTTDELGQETQYVYGTIQRDRSIGFAVFARSPHGTCPRIAWFHAVDPEMAQQSWPNARLATMVPELLHGYIGAVKALVGRCWHQELYEERSDGASDIYPEIMHESKCSDETACTSCSACQATSDFERLFPEKEAK